MPRPALKNVSTIALQAELQKRLARLPLLLKMKAQVEADLADLQGLAGQFGQPVAAQAPAAEEPKPVKIRRRKAKVAKVVAQPVAKPVAVKPAVRKKGQRGTFAETGEAMILRLLAEEPMTTGELAAQWNAVGRGGRVDNELSRMVKQEKIKRAPADTGVGSVYRLAGGKTSVKAVAKPMAKKTAVKAVATKPGKKTFTCPTCKAVFDSGPKLGVHYKAEPAHRRS